MGEEPRDQGAHRQPSHVDGRRRELRLGRGPPGRPIACSSARYAVAVDATTPIEIPLMNRATW